MPFLDMWGRAPSPTNEEQKIPAPGCGEEEIMLPLRAEDDIAGDNVVPEPEPEEKTSDQEHATAPASVRQDNPNHIVMLQAQIQTLYRQMEERMANPALSIQRAQETFETRIAADMAEANRILSADIESELSAVKLELQNMQLNQDRDMEEIRRFVSNEFEVIQQLVHRSIAFSNEEQARWHDEAERTLKQKKNDESNKKHARLEAKLADLEGVVDQVDELRRQVASQQKLLQSCQRHLREMQRDRDVYKEELIATQEAYAAAMADQQQEHPSTVAKAKVKLSEKRQQALKFRETLNHLKFMTEGTGKEANYKSEKREVISRRRDTQRAEKRNPSN